ncbi:hypothetical protein [Pseudophaeobacter sp.]|uniref:hypothetical protein n=1 Tax=Pseudophaeobacter sp. TaxID=1971739 RepID=UPI0032967E42
MKWSVEFWMPDQPPPDQPGKDPARTAPLTPLLFEHQGRSPALALAICLWLAALVFAGVKMQITTWFLVLLTLPVLPGLWELWRNPLSWLELTDDQISWVTATRQTCLPLSSVTLLRLDRRWDFSFRATLVFEDDRKTRIPQHVLPPVSELEQALEARGIACQRHHFTVF